MGAPATFCNWIALSPSGLSGQSQLYCFPCAGGAPGGFARWSQLFPWLGLHALELPGRGQISSPAVFGDMHSLVHHIADSFPHGCPPESQFVGHSFGSVLAYEVIRTLSERALALPTRLLVVCNAPPTHARLMPLERFQTDDQVMDFLVEAGAIPVRHHGNPQVRRRLIPPFRYDLHLIDSYSPLPQSTVPVPVTAIATSQDRVVGPELVEKWNQTSRDFEFQVWPGDHFSLLRDPTMLLPLMPPPHPQHIDP